MDLRRSCRHRLVDERIFSARPTHDDSGRNPRADNGSRDREAEPDETDTL
jgi:hypothetical protein